MKRNAVILVLLAGVLFCRLGEIVLFFKAMEICGTEAPSRSLQRKYDFYVKYCDDDSFGIFWDIVVLGRGVSNS